MSTLGATVELLDQAIALIDAQLKATSVSKPADAAPSLSKQPAPEGKASTPAPPPLAKKAEDKKQKPAAEKPSKESTPAPAANDAVSMFAKVLIKVARVETVDFVENSEKLYKLTVDVGGEIRQVCAGLRQFIPVDELKGALVCAVCNLKPAKLAGNLSEAMLLAGDTEVSGSLVVKLLIPPEGAQPGDQVYVEGGAPSTDTPKQVKSDHFKIVAGGMKVGNGGKATVDGVNLVTDKGAVTLPASIPDGSAIH